jgi:hypothetical protein
MIATDHNNSNYNIKLRLCILTIITLQNTYYALLDARNEHPLVQNLYASIRLPHTCYLTHAINGTLMTLGRHTTCLTALNEVS